MTATEPEPIRIGTLTASSLVRVPADATLREVAEVIDEDDVGAVIVGVESVDGIVSERDVVRAVAAHLDPSTATALSVATTEVVRVDAGAPIDDVAASMMEHYVRHLLVEEDGAVIGVVSARDLLGALVAR